jgi:hypothetical protein
LLTASRRARNPASRKRVLLNSVISIGRGSVLAGAWARRASATTFIVIALSASAGVMLSGCSSSSSAAVSVCIAGDTQSGGDDAYVAKRGCGCIVPAYQKAGGNLQVLTDYLQLMENHVSLNDDERDLRVSKQLDRPGADKAALKAAGTKCKPVYDRAVDNDPNS